MHETVNPYQSPESEAVPDRSLAHGSITEPMLVHLKKASPWLRFVGIVGFVFTGIMVLSGAIMLPFTTTYAFSNIPGFEGFSSGMGLFLNFSFIVYCLGGGALFFFLSLFIYKFGEKIRSYLRTGAEADLEVALKNNSRLWKMLGIICIVSLSFLPLMIIGSIIAVITLVLA